jgi:hypothetical protein
MSARHGTALAILAGLLLGCAGVGDRTGLERRPLGPAPASGWVRVVLDGPAQRIRDSLWVGDAGGAPVPFRWAAETDRRRPLPVRRPLLGRDGQGRATAEFTLAAPADGSGRPERVEFQFRCQADGPWAGRVEVRRRRPGGPWLTLDQDPAPVLYDFDDSGRRLNLEVPLDAPDWRITLVPVQGAPRFLEVTALAGPVPADDPGLAEFQPRREALAATGGQRWRFTLPAPERIVGLQLDLAPPAAPCAPVLRRAGDQPGAGAVLPARGRAWNLPALGTRAGRIDLDPVTADALELDLPEGARLREVRIRIRRETLVFPAEAGQAYYLHSGGRVPAAPGTLDDLPGPDAAPDPPLLALGPAGPDPQGQPAVRTAGDRARGWLPWAAGLAVAVLAWAGYRLFRT